MDTKLSDADFIRFLDYIVDKNLMKEPTARARKVSALRVLSVLDDQEKLDLGAIDPELVFKRFVNKHGGEFSPSSLMTYKSRFVSALDDFKRYREKPETFAPGLAARSSRTRNGVTANKEKQQGQTQEKDLPPPPPPPPRGITFPIPLRDDVVVTIHGLPFNLTSEEAERIGAVVKALARA